MIFQRPERLHKSVRNTRDERGRVKVQVILSSPYGYRHIKGNIVRTLTVANARVSDVFQTIEAAIFPKQSKRT